MTTLLIVTNQPTPYRHELFEFLAREVNLTIIYRRRRETNREWDTAEAEHFTEVFATTAERQPGMTLGAGEALAVLRSLYRHRPDALVLGGYDAILVTILIRYWTKMRGIPFILWSGTHPASTRNNSRVLESWRRWAFSSADAIWAYSKKASSYALQRDARRVTVIGNAHRKLEAPPVITTHERDVHNLLYVGQLTQRKSLDLLLKAMDDLAASGSRFHLTICGSGELGAKASLLRNVTLLGPCDSAMLADALWTAGSFIFPSRTDPWGLAIAEAMEASLVVLCDERCGCVPDLADAQTAILSKFDSSHDIIAALRRLESLPQEELQSLRRRAYARAELFRPEAVAQKIMQDITLLLDPSAGK